jgi:Xaa-Pro aminopeptidase
MLTHPHSRQQRLLPALERLKLDAVVVGLAYHVQYFSAHRPHWLQQGAFILFADGRSALFTANKAAANVAADMVLAYEANWMGTQRQEQPVEVGKAVLGLLRERRAKRIGIDASAVGSQIALGFDGDALAIDPELWQLRRRKDPDELELMKTAVRASEAMYARAREIIRPGVAELEVFTQLHAAAVWSTGEAMSDYLGNDYACGVPGGVARQGGTAAAGQLYVLDLGPSYHGYFADNCRAFAVDGKPTDAQHKAWAARVGALQVVERLARPGVRCRDLVEAVNQHLIQAGRTAVPHHLGHGVGLQPHEFPHLNTKWDDVLMEGEVFTAEPGQYGPELNAGIRLENQYLVTSTGVENLVNFPLDLA